MIDSSDSTPARRLQVALELYGLGEEIQRQNLRREFPQASPEEIERRLTQWLRTRPGAEHGDSDGHPARRFENPS